MVKALLIVVASASVLLGTTSFAFADLVNPDFSTKKCKPGETEVVASYSSKEPFGPRTKDETTKYANNPNYYELVAEGHSFGGSVKYCKTGSDSNTKIIGMEIAGVVIIALLGLFILRRRSAH